MAQRSGFFNALVVNGVPDRTYNADDYSDNLAVIISDGVLRSKEDDLKATSNGMEITIGVGRGWIRGKHFYNDTAYSFVVPTADPANPRKDRIFLRYDNEISGRIISLHYATGTPSAVPTAPTPTDTDTIKDLVICEIDVPANATSVTLTDTRTNKELCGWVYSVKGDESFFTSLDNSFKEWFNTTKNTLASVTMFKQYVWRGTTKTSGQTAISFDIPQYDETGVDIIQVYTNGLLEVEGTDYTLNGSVINFVNGKAEGQEIVVICYKSIDGTGIGSVADKVTELENKVASLDDFTAYNYICTGNADNVALSEIAQTFLNGTDDGKTMTINVYGNLGVTSAFAGAGTSADPFRWFSLGRDIHTSRRICFDFSNCSQIVLEIPQGTTNTIFYGHNVYVRNLKMRVNGNYANTVCVGFNSTEGNILCERSVFNIFGNSGCYLASTGVFRDCSVAVHNAGGVGRCFIPQTNSFLKVFGGDYIAYAASGRGSAVIYVAATMTDAVIITEAVSFPRLNKTGYTQEYAVYDLSANKKGLYIGSVTPLTVSATGQTIYGTINANKTTGIW